MKSLGVQVDLFFLVKRKRLRWSTFIYWRLSGRNLFGITEFLQGRFPKSKAERLATVSSHQAPCASCSCVSLGDPRVAMGDVSWRGQRLLHLSQFPTMQVRKHSHFISNDRVHMVKINM